jgi:Zona pellucida-like domain.
LFADFKAFRFPSTATVNFVATVQFCQDICEPVSKEYGLNVWTVVTYFYSTY